MMTRRNDWDTHTHTPFQCQSLVSIPFTKLLLDSSCGWWLLLSRLLINIMYCDLIKASLSAFTGWFKDAVRWMCVCLCVFGVCVCVPQGVNPGFVKKEANLPVITIWTSLTFYQVSPGVSTCVGVCVCVTACAEGLLSCDAVTAGCSTLLNEKTHNYC